MICWPREEEEEGMAANQPPVYPSSSTAHPLSALEECAARIFNREQFYQRNTLCLPYHMGTTGNVLGVDSNPFSLPSTPSHSGVYSWMVEGSHTTHIAANDHLPQFGSGNPISSTDSNKRARMAYSNSQVVELEKEFHTTRYLNKQRRQELATMLSLSERQVKIWFQNRRMKSKRSDKHIVHPPSGRVAVSSSQHWMPSPQP